MTTQALFCVIQGGVDLDARKECCVQMAQRDVAGFAIPALSGVEAKGKHCKVYGTAHPDPARRAESDTSIDTCTSVLPELKPRYIVGVVGSTSHAAGYIPKS